MVYPPFVPIRWAAVIFVAAVGAVDARSPDQPIRLVWNEGDVAGFATIYDPEKHEAIGMVEYRQTRRGDRLKTWRLSRFRDGSSDEDSAEARVNGVLEALSGRSIIRDERGRAIVEVSIDVEAQRVSARWRDDDGEEHTMEEEMSLPKATYWGPLIHLVLKNFDANEEDGRVVFHTVAPTPKPMAIDMEFRRGTETTVDHTGTNFATTAFVLSPTIHWMIDPIVRRFAPKVTFWMLAGEPPALVRFVGPRNHARQRIRIQ